MMIGPKSFACSMDARILKKSFPRAEALTEISQKTPDRFGAVDVAVLRAQEGVDRAREARVGKAAGHPVAAVVDAIEHDIAPPWAARGNPRHRALIRFVAVVEIGHGAILRLAPIGVAPELERLFGRPKTRHGEAAGAAAALIGDQGIGGAGPHPPQHPTGGTAGPGRFIG